MHEATIGQFLVVAIPFVAVAIWGKRNAAIGKSPTEEENKDEHGNIKRPIIDNENSWGRKKVLRSYHNKKGEMRFSEEIFRGNDQYMKWIKEDHYNSKKIGITLMMEGGYDMIDFEEDLEKDPTGKELTAMCDIFTRQAGQEDEKYLKDIQRPFYRG